MGEGSPAAAKSPFQEGAAEKTVPSGRKSLKQCRYMVPPPGRPYLPSFTMGYPAAASYTRI